MAEMLEIESIIVCKDTSWRSMKCLVKETISETQRWGNQNKEFPDLEWQPGNYACIGEIYHSEKINGA